MVAVESVTPEQPLEPLLEKLSEAVSQSSSTQQERGILDNIVCGGVHGKGKVPVSKYLDCSAYCKFLDVTNKIYFVFWDKELPHTPPR